jgi:hypothetical protein
LRRLQREKEIGMEPEEMSRAIWIGRTIFWQKLRRFEEEMDRVPLEAIILAQNTNELVALNWLLCKW